MNRWTGFIICVVLALLLLLCGWLMPVHLRAVEVSVLKQAGRNTRMLDARSLELLREIPSTEAGSRAELDVLQYPTAQTWSDSDQGLKKYFPAAATANGSRMGAFTDFVVREDNRISALKVLESSRQPAVQELLKARALTNTTTFAPSQMAGGEAFDAAVVMTGILLEQGELTIGLSNEISGAASQANHGGGTEPLEQVLLDFLSLGQRFNWYQLTSFVSKTANAAAFHDQVELARQAGFGLPILFSAVELSDEPGEVTHYVRNSPPDELKDLAKVMRLGAGAVQELVRHDKKLYASASRQWAADYNPFAAFISFTADFCWRMPVFALILKWLLYFGGGFLLALALHFGRPAVSALEAPLHVRGIHVAREILFALGFLLVVLLVSEPFLAQESATTTTKPFRLRIPTVGSAVQSGNTNVKSIFMEKQKWLAMLLFFVLQALLYVTCVVKLAEIRRQQIVPRMKLKLLENEEHLFDGGLYLGFLGTIVSFIVYSLYPGHGFPLMVAYSSTSFGILFVSFFKIFQLRPVRRKLLLEAEAESAGVVTPTATPSMATS